MNPVAAPQITQRASDWTRVAMIRNLNSAVFEKFADLSGFQIVELPQRAQVTADDLTEELRSLQNKSMLAKFRCLPWNFFSDMDHYLDICEKYEDKPMSGDLYAGYYGWNFVTNSPSMLWLDVKISTSGGLVTSAEIQSVREYTPGEERTPDIVDSEGNITLGYAAWSLDDVLGDTYTNSTDRAVAVDAHQTQMIKTLWRFKNLRDPSL